MKTSIKKRVWSLFLALTLIVTVMCDVVTAKAATTETVPLFSPSGNVSGGALQAGVESEKHPFTLEGDAEMALFRVSAIESYGSGTTVSTPKIVGITFKLYNADIVECDSLYIPADTVEAYGGIVDIVYEQQQLPAGNYYVSLTFDDDVNGYSIFSYADIIVQSTPKISDTKATVTVGFTKKLSVEDAAVKSWSSSDKKVAAVDKNGKVTGKKAGKAVITATLDDGSKLTCTVTVKANKYSGKKITVNDVSKGGCKMAAYSASFDKSGNLDIKVRVANNTNKKVTKLSNIKITVKDGNGKTVGTYTLSSKNVSISKKSFKDISFTIKKSDLKKKSADLRSCTITCSFK